VLWSSVLTSDFFLGVITTPKRVTQETAVVSDAAAGRKLMVCFHGLDTEDGAGGTIHFARVDNIVVTPTGKSAKKP
jgi:hypothetical protein